MHRASRRLALAAALAGAGALARAPATTAAPLEASRLASTLDAERLESALKALARSHRQLADLDAIGESRQGRPIWHLELGRGAVGLRDLRPALLVVAGIEGHDLAGTATALRWAGTLLESEGAGELLATTTVHVVPRANPDAAELYFDRPRAETARSPSPGVDDDHDGLVDEDPPDDLDGDGLITWMRVEDPEGEHVLDPEVPRLLVEADRAKGETPSWLLLPEGRDDDGDERWNEDPPGGVNLNRNYPFGYEWFATDAGVHQVSEPETRALADFVVAHPNIALAFTFGDAENLVATPRSGRDRSGAGARGGRGAGGARGAGTSSRGGGRGRFRRPEPPKEIDEDDLELLAHLGERYREALGLGGGKSGGRGKGKRARPGTAAGGRGGGGLEASARPGSFSDWLYFHRGLTSLAARAWSPALQLALDAAGDSGDSEAPDDAEAPRDSEAPDDSEAPGDTEAPDDTEAPRDSEAPGDTEAPDDTGAPGDSADPDDPRGDRRTRGRDRVGGGKGDDRNSHDRKLLAWIDEHAPDRFVAWKAVDHPDFPGRRVEVGGFAPFARVLPPPEELDATASAHAAFLTELLGTLPRVGFRSAGAEHLGRGVHEVTIQVENTGYLPTVTAHGVATRNVHPTRLVIHADDDAFLAGAATTRLGPLSGSGGMEEVRCVLHAPGRRTLRVEVISALGGHAETTVELEAGP